MNRIARALRNAGPSDTPALARLINSAFQVERFFIDGDRITEEEVRGRLRKGTFLLAEDGNGPAGCVYVEFRGERAYLGLLSVDPARQGTGIGAYLANAAEQYCRENGRLFVDLLIVNLRQELPGFYRRLGYVEDGAEPFPRDTPTKMPCHFLRMTKRLDQAKPQAAQASD